MGVDGVVPFSVESVGRKSYGGELGRGHRLLGWIGPIVQLGSYLESRRRGGASDELDGGGVARQGTSTPILGDVTEHAMFNFVPLARAGREVANRQTQAQVIGHFLKRDLPQPRPAAVAAAAVGRDEQFLRPRITPPAHLPPPALDARRV